MNAFKDFIFINLIGYELVLAGLAFYKLYLFFEPLGLLGIIPAMPAFTASVVVAGMIMGITGALFFPESSSLFAAKRAEDSDKKTKQ